ASQRASSILLERFGRSVPPLRTTLHSGEDFVHLLSGLRRLDETLDYLGLCEGDRLGHALSLGVEPRVWAQRAGRVAMSREERLLDLAWEWTCYARQGDSPPGGRHALIQREIAEISHFLFKENLPPWKVECLIRDLHDEDLLRFLGFPDRRPPVDPKEEHKLALDYLTDPQVFQRGRSIIWVDPTAEVEALQHLQDGLRRKVGRMGLTIEVNPSSNLLIGHLGEIGQHPLWRLAPPGEQDKVPPLSVCIGSDDPLTFATTLREEYQLLYDALILKGCSEAVAHDWIERARKAGLSARFTLPQSCQPVGRDADALRNCAVAESPDLNFPP
ncbi:MAG TPA: hypothetical protein VFR31_11860, partial [Thermoanaerobaculia bacterium]|nr:hypothetical protein [Thermoanaerobaculia bacterium]